MSELSGPNSALRTGEFSDTLKLLVFIALSVMMMVVDRQTGWLNGVRTQMTAMAQPFWAVAQMPSAAARKVSTDAGTYNSLLQENELLRRELMVNRARMSRAEAIAQERAQEAGLVATAQASGMAITIASVLDVDLDPTRQRLMLKAGKKDGVFVGQAVMDEGGLLGQVIDVQANLSTVLLITDPAHAVPVMIQRNGVRLMASGSGRNNMLDVVNVPLSTDIKVGDIVVTSGLGGLFSAGLPVGRIVAVRPDDSRAFLMGDVAPAARLDRGLQVMLVRTMPVKEPVQVPAVDLDKPATPMLLKDPSVPAAPAMTPLEQVKAKEAATQPSPATQTPPAETVP